MRHNTHKTVLQSIKELFRQARMGLALWTAYVVDVIKTIITDDMSTGISTPTHTTHPTTESNNIRNLGKGDNRTKSDRRDNDRREGDRRVGSRRIDLKSREIIIDKKTNIKRAAGHDRYIEVH